MRPIEFVPVIGAPIALHRIHHSDDPMSVKLFKAGIVGGTQAAFTMYGMSKNVLSARKAHLAGKVGIFLGTRAVLPVAAVTLGVYVISKIPGDTGSLKQTIKYRGGHSPYPYQP